MSNQFIKSRFYGYPPEPHPLTGVAIASLIVILWGISLGWLLRLPVTERSLPWLGIAVLVRTFLHTGLFIIAHDAMHRSLFPLSRWANDGIGKAMLFLYAFLPYERCRLNHWRHHRHPAQRCDPDFHDGIHCHPISWYLKFMGEYLPLSQWGTFLGCGVTWVAGLTQLFHISVLNLLLFWMLPLVLSSMQLFFFGTYLPHRETADDRPNPHHAHSLPFPVVWSFLTCYHFGYHWEHHEYHQIPWYGLPAIHAQHLSNP